MSGQFQEPASMPAFATSSPNSELNVISVELIRRYRTIPLKIENGILHLAISDPSNQYVLSAITFHTGLKTYPVRMEENELNNLIDVYCDRCDSKNVPKNITCIETPKISQDTIAHYDESLIEFVNHMIENAIKQSVSDIHIEPYAKQCRIRYRCDGLLYEKMTLTIAFATRVITRLKVMAKLDITEHRFPQDSRFYYESTDIRINSCPTLYGEKIVLRILNSNKHCIDINSLGLSKQQLSIFIEKISRPHGMIIVTGPTSSGKTLTLYSALNYLNQTEKNITSLEDPIEIQLAGINQMSIQSKINLDFATLLRAVLRQDPDIIMIGEIRDKETADIAIQAATTGHLVLSSLHTNSAAETIPRLISLGISPLHIASSVSLIIAQRLIRKLCTHCKQAVLHPELTHKTYHAVGCQYCLNGYSGRTGIFELLPINQKIAACILSGENSMSLKNSMLEDNHALLHQSAFEQIQAGITSSDEINRILAT